MNKIVLMLLLLLLAGCSNSSAQTIKSESSGDKLASADTSHNQDRTVAIELKFPISTDLTTLSLTQSTGCSHLGAAVTSYYVAKGYHEDSLETLIHNGYLLFWPRNVMTGEPVSIANQQFTDPSIELFGIINYNKLNKDLASIARVSYKPAEGIWKFTNVKYPRISDLGIAGIIGLSVDMASIDDPDTRYILSLFGQLTNYLFIGTDNYIGENNILPASFQDLRELETLIINENFKEFTDLVNRSNVVFKWGIDEKKMSSYVYLKINGVTYIKRCFDFSEGRSMSAMKTMLNCEYKNLDTSSPILTEKNLASIKIDDQFYVSKDGIVSK